MLETRAYAELARHRQGWMAERLRITRGDDEEASLAGLASAGLVRWDGQRWRTEPVAVDTSMATDEARRHLELHGVDVGRARLEAGGEELCSWSVFAVSCEDYPSDDGGPRPPAEPARHDDEHRDAPARDELSSRG